MCRSKILVVLSALSGAVFSLPLFAQELVTKGNDKTPYQPPQWVLWMVAKDMPRVADQITWVLPESSLTMGRPHPVVPKKACRVKTPEGEKWAFCEL